MGRTLYGIDLDESSFGGLIAGLLTEEELEKLADGGRPDGSVDDADDRDAANSPDTSAADGRSAGGDSVDERGSVADDGTADDRDEPVSGDSFAWGDTPVDSSTGTRDFGAGPGETGEPGGGVDPYVPPGGGDYGDGGADEDEEESGGIVSKLAAHRSLLLKLSVALALVAVVAAVAWKYLGSVKAVVPDRLSGSDADDDEERRRPAGAATDADVSPARRRAKVGAETDEDRTDVDSAVDADDVDVDRDDVTTTADRRAERERSARERSPAEPPSPTEDVDLGALVGLGALALTAAVVRKFGEDRPHDPLVDGPEEE